MKTLRVGIATYEEMKARTVAIARGLYKPASDHPKVWFTSAEAFARTWLDLFGARDRDTAAAPLRKVAGAACSH